MPISCGCTAFQGGGRLLEWALGRRVLSQVLLEQRIRLFGARHKRSRSEHERPGLSVVALVSTKESLEPDAGQLRTPRADRRLHEVRHDGNGAQFGEDSSMLPRQVRLARLEGQSTALVSQRLRPREATALATSISMIGSAVADRVISRYPDSTLLQPRRSHTVRGRVGLK